MAVIRNMDLIKGIEMNDPSVRDASIKVLIGPEEGWDSHVMRGVEIGEGGYSPLHTHPWPHINYIIEGEGNLLINGEENPIKKGSVAFIPPGETHQFQNTGKEKLILICIVPKEGHK
jgi:quercetin dioxygenase-like cupin family protein